MKEVKKTIFNIKILPTLLSKFRDSCDKRGQTMTSVVERFMEEYIEDVKKDKDTSIFRNAKK